MLAPDVALSEYDPGRTASPFLTIPFLLDWDFYNLNLVLQSQSERGLQDGDRPLSILALKSRVSAFASSTSTPS